MWASSLDFGISHTTEGSKGGILLLFQYRELTKDVQINAIEKLRLRGNLFSAVIKLLYAFLWQESTFDSPLLLNPAVNAIGAELIPSVNAFANGLNDFTFYEQNFQVE